MLNERETSSNKVKQTNCRDNRISSFTPVIVADKKKIGRHARRDSNNRNNRSQCGECVT